MIWYFVLGLMFTGASVGLFARKDDRKNKRDPKWMWVGIGALVALVWPVVVISLVWDKLKGRK